MEPNFNSPQFRPDQRPSFAPASPERPVENRPEVFPEQGVERREESAPVAETLAAPVVVPVLPAPVVPDPQATSSGDDTGLLTGVPEVAADEDLIEKEWVDKAKKIIAETQDDPYKREQAVSQLQRDYLRKRYGKEIGATE